MKANKFFFCLVILLVFTNVLAQDKIEAQNKELPCDLDFARLLVEQQVADSKNTEDTSKRVNILIRSADFLWKFDEETSRIHLANAFEVAEDRYNELGFERRKIATFKGKNLTAAVPDYRLEVIQAIAKKDRAWADRLVKDIIKKYEKSAEDRKSTMYNVAEAGVLMRLAFDSIATKPEISLQLYRRAMKYQLDRHWFWNMYSIYRKDANLANQVYESLLNAYVNESPSNLLFLSAYAFGNGKVFGAGRFPFNIGVPTNYVPQRNLQVQFTEVFLNRSERFIENPVELNALPEKNKLAEIAYIVSALNEMEPFVLRDLPNMSARFRLVKSKANASMSEEVRKSLEKKEEDYANQTRSFEELLKRVEEAHEKGTLTDQQIIDMVLTARVEADYQKAEPWIDKVENKKGRDEVLSYFSYNRARLAISERRFQDAVEVAKKVTDLEQKVLVNIKIAEAKVKETKQVNDAELILLDVSQLAQKMDDSATKAKALLGLANAFEEVNHLYALDELSKAVNVINKLENIDIFRDGTTQEFRGNGYEFLTLLIAGGYNLENTFTKISKNDFQLSLAHAQSLDDKFFKTLAVLTVAKNCRNKVKVKRKKTKTQ